MSFLSKFKPLVIPVFENGVRLPEFRPTQEQYDSLGIPNTSTSKEFIVALCNRGFKQKVEGIIVGEKHEAYLARVKEEMAVIEQLGFIDYLLMVWDIMDFCKRKKIPVGRGRGSVGSSLVCYLIGITQVDSVKHKTYFARFLSKTRAKYKMVEGVKYIDGSLAPDIDCDIDYFRREEVIEYLKQRYPGRVCKILTVSTLSAKALIKDVLKTYEEVDETEAKYASALLEKVHGVVEEISDAVSDDEKKGNVAFKEWAKSHKKSVEIAQKLSGLARGTGVHASALAVSYDPIDNLIPLQTAVDDDKVRHITSGYDMYSVQEISLKFDLLGLKTASLIDDVCKMVGIDPDSIDIDDPCIYEFFATRDDFYGIFQFESSAQGTVARRIKPKAFKHIVDALAVARPGASAFLGQYIDYIHRGIYKPIYPLIDPIMKETGGVCLFQETILQMLNVLGMELDECEGLRKAVGKKLPVEIAAYKEKIYNICDKNKHPREVADLVWKIAEDSGGYSFNLSHSVSYSMLTCQTVYLKMKYPREFYLGCLRMARNESDKTGIIDRISREMNVIGLKLLPPDLLLSDADFKIEPNGIRFGLSAVKGLGGKTIEKLAQFRKAHATKLDAFNAAKEAKINIGSLASMIQSGCLSSFGESRSLLVLEAQTYNILSAPEKKLISKLLPDNKNSVLHSLLALKSAINEKGKPVMKETRWNTIKEKYDSYKKIWQQNSKQERFANYMYETRLLGFSYSERLRDIFGGEVDDLMPLNEIASEVPEVNVKGIGTIREVKSYVSKKKNAYIKMSVSDELGMIDILLFNDAYSRFKEDNGGGLPPKGSIVLFKGRKKDGATVFGNNAVVQDNKIYLKVSEMKDEDSI